MKNSNFIIKNGFEIYNYSIRNIYNNSVCVLKKDNNKYVCFESYKPINFKNVILSTNVNNCFTYIFSLDWDNYQVLSNYISNIKPVKSNSMSSFGMGDRLGLVTAAHIRSLEKFPGIFPVVAQQSPRELEKENRSFKSVLLDAVMGILEAGYDKHFGADADHIKSEDRLREGVEAGYSMYTIDVSDLVIEASEDKYDTLDKISLKIIKKYENFKLNSNYYSYSIKKDKLIASAISYQEAMKKVIGYDKIISESLSNYDLEISIDEGKNTTTLEDHLYCAAYLKANEIEIFSIAPKFPGKFQKALDFQGNIEEFEKEAYLHGEISRAMGFYKLSLHSGSDKFSVYPCFKNATNNLYHIKTSGTSYLRAIILTSYINKDLFTKMYKICLDQLDYNKKFYDVRINLEDFPKTLDNINLEEFILDPNVTQLFHISYGSILDELKEELYTFLKNNEANHYSLVSSHIKRHLNCR